MPTETISPNVPNKAEGEPSATSLPVTHNLRWWFLFSLLIAGLTAVAALAGLLYPNTFYPTEELRQMALANDLLTLILGMPILLGSMWLAWRCRLIGLLFWPGAIFYGLYNYFIYLLAMPLTAMYPLYLLIVTLSIYTTIGLVASVDGGVVQGKLNGRIPVRFGGGVLIGFGMLFMLRTLAEMGTALTEQIPIAQSAMALLVADFIMSGAFVIGGVLLWQKRPLGFVGGTGLLFQASMLFVGVIAIVLLQPVLTNAPFLLGDFVVLSVMGLVCFVPFALFVRGIGKAV